MTSGFFEGHEGKVPQTQAEERTGLASGLVSLDANVLLSFYRFSPSARDGLISVLRALGDRVFVSHQAAREFWRNRLSTIDARTQAQDQLSTALEKAERQVHDAIRVWAKQTAADRDLTNRLLEEFSATVEACAHTADEHTDEASTFTYATEHDVVVAALGPLLKGHVGKPLADSEHAEAIAEARRRAEAGIPPGFRDAEKDAAGTEDGLAGDYLVWLQSVQESKRRGLSLVLVTGDEKDDWWWRHRNQLLGPRAELADEFTRGTANKLIMLRPSQLIQHADVLQVSVGEDVQSDVARGSATEPAAWTESAVRELLARLDASNREQAPVIRVAAKEGGTITRERVYEVCHYSPDRMLRGFTRPTNRITGDLQLEGLLDEGVTPMLTPIYEAGVTALRFEIPSEVVDILADSRGE